MRKPGLRGLLVLSAALFVMAIGASSAQGAFGISEWEALTCKENVDTPEAPGEAGALKGPFPIPGSPEQCTDATTGKFFTQATGHPNYGITDFTLNTLTASEAAGFPDGFVKKIVVDTPEGLGVNPEAAPKCTVAQLSATPAPTCSPESLVGFNYLTIAGQQPPCTEPIPGQCVNARVKLPVYNLVPFDGVPSMVGFPTSAPGDPTIIVGALDPSDQHVRFTISDIHPPDEEHPPIIGSRLVFNGQAGNGTYLTMPSNCAGGQTSELEVRSQEDVSDTASYTTSVGADECDSAPFDIDVDAESSGKTGSPEPASVDVQMPNQLAAGERGNSHLLTAKVTLPEGTGINPSLANDLETCSNSEFNKGSDDPVECPDGSRIGSVDVETKALNQDLGGDVYVASPRSNDPSSGEQFRVFIHAFNDRYGVNVRLIGHIFPNLETGRPTVVVPNNPQAPFNSFEVNIDGGARGALTSPETCGPHTTTAKFVPWARPNEEVSASSDGFNLNTAGYGGGCPDSLADRLWNPAFDAAPEGSKAGAFSPFKVHLRRSDGMQEVKQIDVNLAPGMVGRLRGLEYCPESDIDGAEDRSGTSTTASPPCPDSSWLGSVKIGVGSGPDPFEAPGNAYLAGPYKGAPLSLVFVTPALAGPYDLGTVVVRAALQVDPETVQITAVSDEIPDVFGGVKLDIRTIDISLKRQNFTLNPTTCRRPFFVRSTLAGGGGDPSDSDDWKDLDKGTEFQGTECRALQFKPRFFARIFGGKAQTRRAANPRFRAVYAARNGDANLRRAAFVLPSATILDQSHIKTICTRVQLAAKNCPKASIYGYASASSPLLDKPLRGPVYLTSSDNELPDLLADLKGQINVRLRGVISSTKARLKTVFATTPDVPVSKFALNMRGGKRGLLINSRSLCSRRTSGVLNLVAQNRRRVRSKNLQLNIPACRGGRGN